MLKAQYEQLRQLCRGMEEEMDAAEEEADELEKLEAEAETAFTQAAGGNVLAKQASAKATAREERKKLREQGARRRPIGWPAGRLVGRLATVKKPGAWCPLHHPTAMLTHVHHNIAPRCRPAALFQDNLFHHRRGQKWWHRPD